MSSKAFKDRYIDLGDSAEDAFRTWAEQESISVEEWGLKRPNFAAFKDLPKNVRHEPDFICELLKKNRQAHSKISLRHFFVEAKGVGKDQIVKIKKEDLQSIRGSMTFHELGCYIFVNDVTYDRIGMFNITHLYHDIENNNDELYYGEFWEGKPYVGIPTDYRWFLFWEDK